MVNVSSIGFGMITKNGQQLTVNAVGDISLGDHPVRAGYGMRKTFRRAEYKVLDEVASVLKDSDITIGNLETVTSNHGLRKFWLPSYEMRGEPAYIRYLQAAGIDLVGVANNHSMQHGEAAFKDMLEQVRDEHIAVIGYEEGKDKTVTHRFMHEDGIESLFFSVSTRPEEWAENPEVVPYSLRTNPDELIKEVERLRQSCTGFLICSIHWGLEFLDYPGPDQVELGHRLIEAGVDLVLGHHPHVLQPVERYRNGLIFYSLGNFVFDLWPEKMKLSAIARVTLHKDREHEFSWEALEIGNDLIVRKADHIGSGKIASLLSWKRFQEMDNKPQDQEDYKSRYAAERRHFRYDSYRYFVRNVFRYPPWFLVQSLGRTVIRRLTGN